MQITVRAFGSLVDRSRRALMYVPAHDEKKLSKISALGSDSIVLDLEDGVALSSKDKARCNVREILNGRKECHFGGSELTLRVNSVTSDLCPLDLSSIFSENLKTLPSAILLPKVDEKDHIKWFHYEISKYISLEKQKSIGLILFIESCRGLVNLRSSLEFALEASSQGHLLPRALVFGSDDYIADINGVRTESGKEVLYPRQKIVSLAKAFGLGAIDMVSIDIHNTEALEQCSSEAFTFGFTGKQVIHPKQIPVVQKAFSSSETQVQWAKRLLDEFSKREKVGEGAFSFEGKMIDMPLVKQARNILLHARDSCQNK